MMVKICGITDEEDARCALEAGASALGFNFYPASLRFISPLRASQIVSALPCSVLRVGVFVNPASAEVLEAVHRVPLDVVQLHGPHVPALPSDLRIWRAMAPAPAPAPHEIEAEAYLLDTPSRTFGGSGVPFSWKIAAGFPGRAILAGGLHPCNVAEAIRLAQPWGVDACSRLERAPGRKDHSLVRDFVAAALAASSAPSLVQPVL